MQRGEPHYVYGARCLPRGGYVQSGRRNLQQSERAQRHGVQRQQCVYTNGSLPGGNVYRDCGGLFAARYLPRRRYVRSGDGPLQQSGCSGRHDMQRRQWLHPDGYLPGGNVHRREPGHLHAARFMSLCGYVQSGDGSMHQSGSAERHHVQRQQRLHADRPVPSGNVHGVEHGRLRGVGSMPHRGDV